MLKFSKLFKGNKSGGVLPESEPIMGNVALSIVKSLEQTADWEITDVSIHRRNVLHKPSKRSFDIVRKRLVARDFFEIEGGLFNYEEQDKIIQTVYGQAKKVRQANSLIELNKWQVAMQKGGE